MTLQMNKCVLIYVCVKGKQTNKILFSIKCLPDISEICSLTDTGRLLEMTGCAERRKRDIQK